MSDPPLLEARDVAKHYPITEGWLRRETGRVRAVDGVTLALREGEAVGLVGESGCGKTTLARTMLGLTEPTAGVVRFRGHDLAARSKRERKRFRREVQPIFQDPGSSLDPRMTAGESVAEPLAVHGMRDRSRRRKIAADLLERVGLSRRDADRYPHELSGGQKQRVALARALVVNPSLLIADEPTAALDVSVRADVLSLLDAARATFGLGVLLVSHDVSVVREVCDRVAVMYLGRIVELGPTDRVLADPKHPYTRALLDSVPRPDPRERGRSPELRGDVPSPADPPSGCRFHTRCPAVIQPADRDLEPDHWRSIVELRTRVERGGIDVSAVRERAAADGELDADDATGAGAAGASDGDRRVRAAIRREFDLPGSLGDPDADRDLAAALSALAEGREDEARERLAAAFGTVCASRDPSMRPPAGDGDATREVACHLYGDGNRAADAGEESARDHGGNGAAETGGDSAPEAGEDGATDADGDGPTDAGGDGTGGDSS